MTKTTSGEKTALVLAAFVTTVAALVFVVAGVDDLLFHDKLLGVAFVACGGLLGSFVPDYVRMLREYL